MKNLEMLDASSVIHNLVIVVFDMCSSSKIIEDLSRTKSLIQYDRLMKNLRLWLWSNAKASNFILYKFTGDGWILLFPALEIDGESLMRFLVRLSCQHNSLWKQMIEGHLESIPESTGLTFGIETGELRKVVLGNEVEFVGRALNVACRLQSSVKDKGRAPDYLCLFSRKMFNTYLRDMDEFKFHNVTRTLRNISGGERYRCMKVNLTNHVRRREEV